MKQRIISGVIIAIACILLGLAGGPVLALVLMCCSVVAYCELTRAMKVHEEYSCGSPFAFLQKKLPDDTTVRIGFKGRLIRIGDFLSKEFECNAAELAGYIAVILFYAALIAASVIFREKEAFVHAADNITLITVFGLFFALMAIYVLTFPKYHADQVIDAFFSFVYAPVMLSFIFRARLLPYGKYIYALVFFCSWVCDTSAYAVGMKFGKRKLAPVLSPKKSVEGAIGGICGSAVVCGLMALFMQRFYDEAGLIPVFIIIGICGSIISQIGDLTASAIKRNHNIKDYGKIIPGHGGIMDRFDSVIFTAPVIYFLAVLLMGSTAL